MAKMNVKRRWAIREVPPDQRKPKRICSFEPVDPKGKLKDKNGNDVVQIVHKEVAPTEREFDIIMPRDGSVVRVTESRLRQLGLNGNPELVDMNSGEMLPVMEDSLLAPLG